MSKTVPLREDIHALIVDKQKELKTKRNITVRISDLLAMYVRHGIEKTEKLLGLKEDESSDDIKQNGAEGVKQNGAEGVKQNGAEGVKQNGAEGVKQNGAEGAKQNGAEGAKQNGVDEVLTVNNKLV